MTEFRKKVIGAAMASLTKNHEHKLLHSCKNGETELLIDGNTADIITALSSIIIELARVHKVKPEEVIQEVKEFVLAAEKSDRIMEAIFGKEE